MTKKIGYLSAAPRVSTRPEAELVGPKTHILGVIQAFETLGWNVTPFIVGDHVPLSWIVKGSESNMQRSILRILIADILRLVMGVVNKWRAYRKLGRKVDIVYERLATLQSLGSVFKKRGRLWVLETNAPLFIEAKSDRQAIILSSLAKYLELKAYKNCDILVCISETLRDIIIEETGISPRKVVVVPNGVDVAFFDPTIYRPIRMFTGFTIGFIGNLASWQGLFLLLDAVSDLRKEGKEINVAFVGDGPDRPALEKKSQELGLSENVKFVGFVSQMKVPNYIAGFDIGYSGQTLRTEKRMYCSPIKLYEYMAMGTPAIASDYEDTRQVIKDGTGFLFQIDSRQDLKEIISKAYRDRGNLPAMGNRSRNEIIKNHSWVARVSKLIDTIDDTGR